MTLAHQSRYYLSKVKSFLLAHSRNKKFLPFLICSYRFLSPNYLLWSQFTIQKFLTNLGGQILSPVSMHPLYDNDEIFITFNIGIRVDMVGTNHDKVLTQWRHMPMGQFHANIFLIQITSTYFWASEVFKNQRFKNQLFSSF